MPEGLLPTEGIALQLSAILNEPITGYGNLQVILWVNDYTPTAATTLADLVEATWSGYARKTVVRGSWEAPTVTGACGVTTYTTMPQEWTVTATTTQVNYGWALYDSFHNVLWFVQRFDNADLVPLPVGYTVKLLPRYTLTSAAC